MNNSKSNFNFKQVFLMLCLFAQAGIASSATYWVSKSGVDSNPCSETLPCLTIQKGVDQLSAGDTLNIKEGVYSPRGYTDSGQDVFFHSIRVGVLLKRSGTNNEPITIQADPAAPKRSVVIDQNYQANGFYFAAENYAPYQWPDYIHIKSLVFRNILHSAIASQDRSGTCSDGPNLVSQGVVIEGNEIYNVDVSVAGTNNAGIRMDSTRGWIIRNNKISNIMVQGKGPSSSPNSGIIEAYNVFDVLIENNEFSNAYTGIYWKESPIECPTYPVVQSTVKNNIFNNIYRGIHVEASSHAMATYNIIRNNIFSGYSAALFPNGTANESIWDIQHNFFDERSTAFPYVGIIAIPDNVKNVIMRDVTGNIFHSNAKRDFGLFDTINTPQKIEFINDNVYTSEPFIDFRSGVTYSSLDSWKTSNHPTVSDPSPDSRSIILDISQVVIDYLNFDFKLPGNSTANNFMPNGDNAGPYQHGNEVIGLLNPSILKVKATFPSNFSATIQ